uniref:Acetylcholinesterase (inferred by orthology to a zebrafish protein) n=1 Tax=Strongyloides venezuelensis TaxID=75913 RepID=A0A0K0F519_STRVS
MKHLILLLSIISLILCAKGKGKGKSKGKDKNKNSETIVNTPYGKIQGKKITIKKDQVSEFLGIPYARPPIGYYRFKGPIPLRQPAWNETFYAVHKAVACPQIIKRLNFKDYDDLLPHNGLFESCLKLNMWVPKGKNLPILVILHDGFYSIRTASVDRYYGAYLAQKAKSIVITLNFRLGFFGFSYLGGGEQIPGNMGLLDQQTALKWIRTAAESFGGNKNSITLIGFGSGASSVSAHLFSDDRSCLFHRAIISSGIITSPLDTIRPQFAESNTRLVADRLGCKGSNRRILSCLQKMPTMRILRVAQYVLQQAYPQKPYQFLPITNDYLFFNGSLMEKIINHKYKKDVDLMFGVTSDAATLLMATVLTNSSLYNCQFFPSRSASHIKNSCDMKNQNFREVVKLASSLLKLNSSEEKELSDLYINLPKLSYTQKSVRLLSDVLYNCEIYKFAVRFSNYSSSNVYFYENQKRSPLSKWPSWTGVMQGDEINDIFAYPFRHSKEYKKKTLKKEQKYSEALISLVKEFSKSGKPSKKWKKFKGLEETKALILNSKLNLKKLKMENVLSICPNVNRIILKARRRLQVGGPGNVTLSPITTTATTTTQVTTTTKKKGIFSKIKSWFKKHLS